MSIWRIYRVPGSREFWHIDSGQGTVVFSTKKIEIFAPCKTVDMPEGNPRAWLEVDKQDELHFFDGVAVFGKVPNCDCAQHENQVCDVCQKVKGKEADKQ